MANKNARPMNDSIPVGEMLYSCLSHWPWFVVSCLIALIAAYIYIRNTPPTYQSKASVFLRETPRSHSGDANLLKELGVSAGGTSFQDEIALIGSPRIISEVVRMKQLDIYYSFHGPFYDKILYGVQLPIIVTFGNYDKMTTEEERIRIENLNTSFDIDFRGDGSFVLSQFPGSDQTVIGKFGELLSTPAGEMHVDIKEGDDVKNFFIQNNIQVRKSSIEGTANRLLGGISVEGVNKDNSVVEISCVDPSPERAQDIVNTLIKAYNIIWATDKNQNAVSANKFINARLSDIEAELDVVEEDISGFKSRNLMPSIDAAASNYTHKDNELYSRLVDLNMQLSMVESIQNFLTANINSNENLPLNTGLSNSTVDAQLKEYNRLLEERNAIVTNAGPEHPRVKQADVSIENMRVVILGSLENLRNTLQTQVSTLSREKRVTTAKISDSPNKEKYLLGVQRQQKVKEQLYLFLLQKLEETQLAESYKTTNAQILSAASANHFPISPIKSRIYLIALLIGLAIPLAVVFLKVVTDTFVHQRRDLENLTIPYIGEVPLDKIVAAKDNRHIGRKRRINNKPTLVVGAKGNDFITDAFGIVRTKLAFVLGKGEHKAVMITSAHPNSGKTFVTLNLAASFSANNKKVLIIDLDLRRATLSKFVGDDVKSGISDYLNEGVEDIEQIIYRNVQDSNIDVIPCGTRPPNSTELLANGKLKDLVAKLKERYDIIIFDSTPYYMLADAAIINEYSDATVFIIRAGRMDKSMLPEFEKMYQKKTFHNMTVLLNGTTKEKRGYGYGYGYGYTYGYTYGQ